MRCISTLQPRDPLADPRGSRRLKINLPTPRSGIKFVDEFAKYGIRSTICGSPGLTEADYKELIPRRASPSLSSPTMMRTPRHPGRTRTPATLCRHAQHAQSCTYSTPMRPSAVHAHLQCPKERERARVRECARACVRERERVREI